MSNWARLGLTWARPWACLILTFGGNQTYRADLWAKLFQGENSKNPFYWQGRYSPNLGGLLLIPCCIFGPAFGCVFSIFSAKKAKKARNLQQIFAKNFIIYNSHNKGTVVFKYSMLGTTINDWRRVPTVAVLFFLLNPCCCLPARSSLFLLSR